ncbi:MAG TPA: UbiA family prenyltransferase [Pirellulaceae bacterium]|nr:UbiA family prenyltransferase [Pirellulaceae bacterium]
MSQPIRPEFDLPPPSPWLPYLRLMRLPNVFTAMADIAMGYLFVHHASTLPANWPVLAVLIAASSLIYTAGMVLNDVYDIEVDRQERPFRPLPSGQISLGFALRLGYLLLICGVLLGTAAGWLEEGNKASHWRSGIVAVVLALAVIAYDAWLKHTPLGPLGMGLCRMLNALLGMSAAGIAVPSDETFLTYHTSSWLIAGGLGLYITGVTWFARSEAAESSRMQLIVSTLVIAGGIVLVALLPQWPHPEKKLLVADNNIAYLLFAVLALPMVRRAVTAISDPQPANVQAMIKHCILSLIMLNAAITMLTSGPMPGLAIAALLAPSLLLGRWVYST